MYRPIYEAALSTLPAVFVGTGWETWDGVGNLKEGDFQCMKDMHASHKLLPFPQDGTHTTFSSTCIYWRPLEESDGQSSDAADVVPPNGATGHGVPEVAKLEDGKDQAQNAGASHGTEDAKEAIIGAIQS